MLIEQNPPENNITEQTEAQAARFKRNRSHGYVVSCNGVHAVIQATLSKDDSASEDYWAVGQLLSIQVGNARTVGMLYKTETIGSEWDRDGKNDALIHVELVGEILENEDGSAQFTGGLSVYPHLGAIAHRIRLSDLMAVFENTDNSAVKIGSLSQSREIDALLSVDDLISRHFAVLGTTGVGKSTSVGLLVRKIVHQRPDVAILVLDPHNEFAGSFDDICITMDEKSLNLPFWLFKFDELIEVIYRGQAPIIAEVDILRDAITESKNRFKGDDSNSLVKRKRSDESLTADSPVPYRISDLTAILKDRLGSLDARDERSHIKALMNRLASVMNDPRYQFMFSTTTIDDSMMDVLAKIYRIPSNGRPVTDFQLSGIPSDVVNAVVSVLCRLAFDLAVWSDGKYKTLVLCEEAHRYIPNDQTAGFLPTRQSIARIAKEGRKYGVSLGLVSQRPSELDETILSQCSTVFAMRLSNERDQLIMRKAISGASSSYINFLPSLANREAIAFGQGVATPMRMTFETVHKQFVPGNHLDHSIKEGGNQLDLSGVIARMRSTKRSGEADARPVITPQAGEAATTPAPANQFSARFRTEIPLRRMADGAPTGAHIRDGRRQGDIFRKIED